MQRAIPVTRKASHDPIRQGNAADQSRGGDAAFLPRLRDERDRRPRPPRCARRPEAGASPRPVRDARGQQRLEPALQEERADRRRRDGQIPPARRQRHLRHDRAHGPAFLAAPHAGRRPGQLRLGRRRQPGGDALHRNPPGQDRPRDACRSRQGDGRFRAELRRQREGAAGSADQAAEPAHQRLVGYRGRHGDEHSAAQPERGRRRLPARAEEPRRDDRRADGDHSGARLPDRRNHPRPERRARRLPHRPRPRDHARQVPLRGHRQGPAPVDHRRRDSLSGEQEEPARADGRAGAREEAGRHQPHPGRVRQVGHARRDRAQARRGAGGCPEQSLQADPAAGFVRHQHGRADRRPAEGLQPEGPDRDLPRAPPRGRHAAHRVRAAQGPRARPCARRPGGGARQHRRVHRHHQGLADPADRQERADGQELGLVDGARNAGPGGRRIQRGQRRLSPRRPLAELRSAAGRPLSPLRRPGRRDPADAPATPDRPRAGQDPRRIPRGDEADLRPARDPRHAGTRHHHHQRRTGRAEAGVRPDQARRPAQLHREERHRSRDRRPDHAGRHGRDALAHRLHQEPDAVANIARSGAAAAASRRRRTRKTTGSSSCSSPTPTTTSSASPRSAASTGSRYGKCRRARAARAAGRSSTCSRCSQARRSTSCCR